MAVDGEAVPVASDDVDGVQWVEVKQLRQLESKHWSSELTCVLGFVSHSGSSATIAFAWEGDVMPFQKGGVGVIECCSETLVCSVACMLAVVVLDIAGTLLTCGHACCIVCCRPDQELCQNR